MISSRVPSSRLPVGSSARRTPGFLTSARAIATAAAGRRAARRAGAGPVAQPHLGQRLRGALLPLRGVHAGRDQRGLDVLLGGQGG